jgi:hypothetical protein
MPVNKAIVGGAIGITTVGVVTSIVQQKPITKIVIGGYVVALIGSLADLIGGQVSVLAGGIIMAAFFGVLLTVFPWQLLSQSVGAPREGQPPAPTPREGAPKQT